jgi:KipI family sensor histidine kinase inhibitor
MGSSPRILDCGDGGLYLEFGDTQDIETSLAAVQFGEKLERALPTGLIEIIPAFASLTVIYDPLVVERADLVQSIEALEQNSAASTASSPLWTIPVLYGHGEDCDLEPIAAEVGLTADAVIELHSQEVYQVYMLGFLPGFAYLGDVKDPLRLSRRKTPRARVPRGSVAIVAGLTAVYPLVSPGGWHLLGTTPVRMWDVARQDRPLLKPGDKVRFQPISEQEAQTLAQKVQQGWAPAPVEC